MNQIIIKGHFYVYMYVPVGFTLKDEYKMCGTNIQKYVSTLDGVKIY